MNQAIPYLATRDLEAPELRITEVQLCRVDGCQRVTDHEGADGYCEKCRQEIGALKSYWDFERHRRIPPPTPEHISFGEKAHRKPSTWFEWLLRAALGFAIGWLAYTFAAGFVRVLLEWGY